MGQTVILGLGGLAALVVLWFLLPFGVRRLSQWRLAQRCREARVIVLSYDDGPGTHLTPALLNMLSEAGVRASFFVLGSRLAAQPPLVARLLDEGHELGRHEEEGDEDRHEVHDGDQVQVLGILDSIVLVARHQRSPVA